MRHNVFSVVEYVPVENSFLCGMFSNIHEREVVSRITLLAHRHPSSPVTVEEFDESMEADVQASQEARRRHEHALRLARTRYARKRVCYWLLWLPTLGQMSKPRLRSLLPQTFMVGGFTSVIRTYELADDELEQRRKELQGALHKLVWNGWLIFSNSSGENVIEMSERLSSALKRRPRTGQAPIDFSELDLPPLKVKRG